MKIYKYELGQWIKDGHELLDWDDSMHEYKDFLESNTFSESKSFHWGKEYSDDGHIIFYPQDKDDICWLADIPTTNSSFYFFIPDHPSFLMFKKEYKKSFESKEEFIWIEVGSYIRKSSINKIDTVYYKERDVIQMYTDDGEMRTKEFSKSLGNDFLRNEFGI